MVKLDAYERQVREIRRYAIEKNISESDVNKVFDECLKNLKHCEARRNFISATGILKHTFLFTIISILCAIVSFNHPPTMNLLMRNSQNFIYPGMKIFRQFAVPILNEFPSLTEFYDEWCLLENPYFRVADMDCQPCRSVNSIPDLSGLNISSTLNVGLPFTTLESIAEVRLGDIVRMYNAGKDVFDQDAGKVVSNNNSYRIAEDIVTKRLDLHPTRFKNTRIVWRMNRMTPGRMLRKLFPKPEVTPDWWGQSTEKFVLIEEPKSPAYVLPNTECSNVILRCGSGERLIKLVPSPECQQECRSMDILLTAKQTRKMIIQFTVNGIYAALIYFFHLIPSRNENKSQFLIKLLISKYGTTVCTCREKEAKMLWYNWWYWRPVSLPMGNSTSISISYLTSFC